MARYYRRHYTRVVKPKKKWASNITVWNASSIETTSFATILVANKTQDNAPTPTILKTGNFKITADIYFRTSATIANGSPSCMAYIMYVPEGWEATPAGFDSLITRHPEWIMATKIMGGNFSTSAESGFGVETLNMSTRLKRNLNSGDSIVLYLRASFTSSVTEVRITGNCRYWTCAN